MRSTWSPRQIASEVRLEVVLGQRGRLVVEPASRRRRSRRASSRAAWPPASRSASCRRVVAEVAQGRLDRRDVPAHRRTGPRADRRAPAPPRGSRTARRDRGSSGTWRSTGSRRPAVDRERLAGGRRPGTRRGPRRDARARARSSTASRRARRRRRAGAGRGASRSTCPVPQPASSTRSSPARSSQPTTAAPHRGHRDRQPVVGGGVPVPRARLSGRYCWAMRTISPPSTRDPPPGVRHVRVVGLRGPVDRGAPRVEVARLSARSRFPAGMYRTIASAAIGIVRSFGLSFTM